MTRFLFAAAFVLGALAIAWMAAIFISTDALGLIITLVIAAVFAIGTLELVHFRRATATLTAVLSRTREPITDLNPWLDQLDSTLHNPVRLRIEGERSGLPAPVITPYLVGLLVMLGLLGTFVGMVDTLKGAVLALEGTSELEAIRAGLAEPIEGLGLAFGTSVAGVAASAMLGLLSTISRRERLLASRTLDSKIAKFFAIFSRAHNQQQAYDAIRAQAQALPAVANTLDNLAQTLETMGETIGERLTDNQQAFQQQIHTSFTELASSVDTSLKASLAGVSEQASKNIQPIVEKTLAELRAQATATQTGLSQQTTQQLQTLNEGMAANGTLIRESLSESLEQQAQSTTQLLNRVQSSLQNISKEFSHSAEHMAQSFNSANESALQQQSEKFSTVTESIGQQLSQLRDEEQTRGDAAVARLATLETKVAEQLASLGQALEGPMTRLIETASETPRAAAEVIEQLRGEITKNLERDNNLLEERTRLIAQLDNLAESLQQSANGHKDVIEQLANNSADTMTKVSAEFSQQIDGQLEKLATVADHFEAGGNEMASLSEAFDSAVQLFSQSNNQLIDNLARIEQSLEQSNNRSEEQLGYYVAQAREIIDHNLLSQKQILDALREQARQPTAEVC